MVSEYVFDELLVVVMCCGYVLDGCMLCCVDYFVV